MRTLAGLLIGIATLGCGPKTQEPTSGSATSADSPQLLVDQTRPKDVAAYVQRQALASVAAASNVTVADIEAKVAAGDAETTKALDEAKSVERNRLAKWQSAKTYKFAGALKDFVDMPRCRKPERAVTRAIECSVPRVGHCARLRFPSLDCL